MDAMCSEWFTRRVKSSMSPLDKLMLDADVWLRLPSGPDKMLVGDEGAWM